MKLFIIRLNLATSSARPTWLAQTTYHIDTLLADIHTLFGCRFDALSLHQIARLHEGATVVMYSNDVANVIMHEIGGIEDGAQRII